VLVISSINYFCNNKYKKYSIKDKSGYDISRGVTPKPCLCDSDNVYNTGKMVDMKLIELAFLAIGGVAGTFLRYKFLMVPTYLGALQVNVLIVNVIGSFVLGAFAVLSQQWNLDGKYALLVAIGFCGSLTTMSALAYDTTALFNNIKYGLMVVNILANVGLSVAAVFGGKALLNVLVGNNPV
jgi:CrcB protein